MKYEVRLSDEAYENIDEIADYIRFKYANPIAADRFISRISDVAYSLDFMPNRIKLNAPELNNPSGLRYITSGKHSIIFQILDNQTVWIDAVWYCGRDISTKLRIIEESELFVDSYQKLTNNEVNFESMLDELGLSKDDEFNDNLEL